MLSRVSFYAGGDVVNEFLRRGNNYVVEQFGESFEFHSHGASPRMNKLNT